MVNLFIMHSPLDTHNQSSPGPLVSVSLFEAAAVQISAVVLSPLTSSSEDEADKSEVTFVSVFYCLTKKSPQLSRSQEKKGSPGVGRRIEELFGLMTKLQHSLEDRMTRIEDKLDRQDKQLEMLSDGIRLIGKSVFDLPSAMSE